MEKWVLNFVFCHGNHEPFAADLWQKSYRSSTIRYYPKYCKSIYQERKREEEINRRRNPKYRILDPIYISLFSRFQIHYRSNRIAEFLESRHDFAPNHRSSSKSSSSPLRPMIISGDLSPCQGEKNTLPPAHVQLTAFSRLIEESPPPFEAQVCHLIP